MKQIANINHGHNVKSFQLANSQWKYQCRTINDPNWTSSGLPFDVESEYECVDKNHVMGQSHFECSRCGNRYTWIKSLQRHQMICGRWIEDEIWQRHETFGSNYEQQTYQCSACGQSYTWLHNLKRHQLKCGSNKEAKYQCHMYPFAYVDVAHRIIERLQHPRRRRGTYTPPEQRQFFCSACGNGYKWKISLKRHQRLECAKQPKYSCNICGKLFYRHYLLRDHMSSLFSNVQQQLQGQQLQQHYQQPQEQRLQQQYQKVQEQQLQQQHYQKSGPILYSNAPIAPNSQSVQKNSSSTWKILPKPANSMGLTTVLVPSADGGQPKIAYVNVPKNIFDQMYPMQQSPLLKINLCEKCKRVFTDQSLFIQHVQKYIRYTKSWSIYEESKGNENERYENSDEYSALWMLEKNTQNLEMNTQILPGIRKSYRWKLTGLDRNYDSNIGTSSFSQDSGKVVRAQLSEYICSDCGKKYKWLDSLKRHQRVECGNKQKKFSCHMCDRKFKYRYEMRNHLSLHHDETSTSSSNWTIDKFYQYQTLYFQMMAKNQRTEAVISGIIKDQIKNEIEDKGQKDGNKVNSEQQKLKNPVSRSCGYMGYSCPRCGNTYTRTHSLNRHVNFECVWKKARNADDGPPYLCPRCGRSYTHKCNLKRHWRLECSVPPRFQCVWDDADPLAFDSEIGYHHHHLLADNPGINQPGNVCKNCEHVVIYSKEKKKRFVNSVQNKYLASGSRKCCHKCGKSYKYATHLKFHINYECGKPPRFQCPYCVSKEYKCKRKSNLYTHIRHVHPGRDVFALELEI
ncbi:RB-associated KRAB zinc finger protein-like [Leptopilina heterotoma]|uniref:RB-associated KRAB zinc finger protein-like n=1 Tax=Leptopilina heterotoma TaxID=63436 RepID=UPI001CA9A547|nr:RB-associated KRAB zinc finger protein-like [Leptopilina heterotoma]